MRRSRGLVLALAALALSGSLPACTVFRKCGLSGCPDDARISAEVRAQLDRYPELQAPNLISIQTLDHVVYLNGQVNTDPERNLAKTAAARVAGVTRVVNNINLEPQGR
jgi:osmotically-inducible protein OsmY